MQFQKNRYDVIIIGGGPAGYTAALYCARAALSTLLLEKFAPGGQMGTTDRVENYPGFPEGVDGFTLATEMQKQAERFGAESSFAEVTAVKLTGREKLVEAGGETVTAKAVIIATGARPRELGLTRERELRGKGVSYCATCDGAFFRNREVVVIGGGDTAAADAVFLSRLCKKVTLVHRRNQLRASRAYSEPLNKKENVEFLWESTAEEILGGDKVEGLKVRNVKTDKTVTVPCSGIFVAVGTLPNTSLFTEVVLNQSGYIEAGENTKTNLPGVFAVGDVRSKPLRQIVTACADGAVAAYMAEEYLQSET